nr:MAPEG family protein [Sphingomonas japonica]
MAAALAITVTILSAALVWPWSAAERIDRASAAAIAALFIVAWLAAAIGDVARQRFFSATDIAGSGSGAADGAIRGGIAILQNTLEQVTLAIPVYLAIAVLLPHPGPVLAALVALFCMGRLLFWRGCPRGASARAFGFALTFYPTVAGLGIALFVGIAHLG